MSLWQEQRKMPTFISPNHQSLTRRLDNRGRDHLKLVDPQKALDLCPRRAAAAGIMTPIGNHSFRATGITAYLENRGGLGACPGYGGA